MPEEDEVPGQPKRQGPLDEGEQAEAPHIKADPMPTLGPGKVPQRPVDD